MEQAELKKLWDENRTEFIRFYSTEQQKPLTHAQLEKAFVDINGNQIYKFSSLDLPISRFGKQKQFLQWLAKGLTDEEDRKIDNTLADIVLNGTSLLEVKKGCAGLLAEKEIRRQMVIHTEIFYNLVALELIRHDENPEVFDPDIHMEKIKTFKKMTKEGSTYFFFQQTALASLSKYLKYTQAQWDHYWEESEIKLQSLNPVLKVIASEIMSKNQKATLQSN